PKEPVVYLELAQADEKDAPDRARQDLEEGLKQVPGALGLMQALSRLEFKAGHTDRAVELLERGLQAMPDQVDLRFQLAFILAGRGDSGGLLLQIQELRRGGFSPPR